MKVNNNAPSNAQALETQKTSAKAPIKNKSGIDSAGEASAAARGGSNIEISDDARLMQKATELATNAPDIRQEKVASLKQAIKAGTYKMDAGAIADKLLEDHLNTNFGQNEI